MSRRPGETVTSWCQCSIRCFAIRLCPNFPDSSNFLFRMSLLSYRVLYQIYFSVHFTTVLAKKDLFGQNSLLREKIKIVPPFFWGKHSVGNFHGIQIFHTKSTQNEERLKINNSIWTAFACLLSVTSNQTVYLQGESKALRQKFKGWYSTRQQTVFE